MRRDNGQLTAASPRQASDVSRTSKAAPVLPVLPRLTSLRWFAALAVFLVHADSLFQWAPLRLFRFGASGVTFFFILSGFVLTWSMVPNLSARTFWWRRFARIYPACFVALMGTAIAIVAWPRMGLPDTFGAFVSCVLLLQAWVPSSGGGGRADIAGSFDSPQWSLSAEAFFYAIFPWLVVRLRRYPPAKRRLIAGSWLGCAAAISVLAASLGHGFAAYTDPLVRCGEFVLGIVLAMAVKEGWRPRLPILAGVVLVAAAAEFSDLGSVQRLFPVEDYIMVVPAALLIVAAAIADLEGRAGWLRTSWAIYLGELSFCFYLVHYPVMWGFSRGTWGTENWTGLAGLLPVGVCFVVSAATAVVLHHCVESPVRRRLLARGAVSRARQ